MEVTRFHNTHNVHVKTNLATKEQLDNSVRNFIKELCKMFPSKNYDKCEILTNLVVSRGESVGYAYLWVQNPEVYFILCGFNPDGSERFEEYIEKEAESIEDDLDLDLSTMDLNNIIQEKQMKEPIKIKKPLGPILNLPGYEYTEAQSEKAYQSLLEEEELLASKESREMNKIEKPNYGYFECKRSDTTSIEEDMSHNILYGKIPNWVTEKMLVEKFNRFSEPSYSKDVKHFNVNLGNPCKDVQDYREVIIKYSIAPKGIATLALQMTRKTTFINPTNSNKAECVFNYYRVRDKKIPSSGAGSYNNHSGAGSDSSPKKPFFKSTKPGNNDFLNRNSLMNRNGK
jgi:hypothetical protein